MMAMDVVDTLRHEAQLVEKELGQDARDAALKERLRTLYRSQGLTVTERMLDEGIAALRGSRFTYSPPPAGWPVTLARLWVTRLDWGRWAGAGAVLVLLWFGWALWSGGAEGRLAARIEAAAATAQTLSRTQEAQTALTALLTRGQAALAAGDIGAAQTALAGLEAMKTELAIAYELRIVSRPGEPSALWRVPDINTAARNHYAIVEAVTPDGRVLERDMLNEETGRTARVSKWGQRVPEAVFDAIAADKRADGIVQDRVLGRKAPGALAPDYAMPVLDGAITEWDE